MTKWFDKYIIYTYFYLLSEISKAEPNPTLCDASDETKASVELAKRVTKFAKEGLIEI